jgi:hypothetical protein
MEALMPILSSVGGSLVSKLVGSMFGGGGGGGSKQKAAPAQLLQNVQKAAPKTLFQPEQIKQATDKYSSEGTAKWNQILANMGAGGGTGGPDLTTQIGSQADAMGKALGGLTTESGYGDSPTANLDAILKGVEGGISPKYSVYG